MQGRLTPPQGDRFQAFPAGAWREELAAASGAGIDGIEWIYERYGVDENPLASDDGAASLPSLAADQGVVVESCCADWFMESPLLADRRARCC